MEADKVTVTATELREWEMIVKEGQAIKQAEESDVLG